MRVNSHVRDTVTSGLAGKYAFKVEMNAMMFHSVIDGIYTDKIRAPMRELATNARDGHAVAGKLDQPFDVFLPSTLNPVFRVRDYGCSMDDETILNLYTTMFASSKRDTNDAVGMIGLGSKSPFAYTSIFNVTCWINGEKRTYCCFIEQNGEPQVSPISVEPSNEPEGVEVSFAVKSTDINQFREAAHSVFFGFDPHPNILNESFVRHQPVVALKGNDWTIYDATTVPFRTLMVRQGCVMYPVAGTSLNAPVPFLNWPVVVDFPIGSLSVNTSREGLGYDQPTRKVLQDKFDTILQEMTVEVEREFEACESYLDACVKLTRGLAYGQVTKPLYTMLQNNLSYKGRVLQTQVQTPGNIAGVSLCKLARSVITMGQYRQRVVFRSIVGDVFLNSTNLLKEYIVVTEGPKVRLGASRMRRVIRDNTEAKNILWIRWTSEALLATTLYNLGNPPVVDLATIETLSGATSEKAKREEGHVSLRYVDVTGQAYQKDFTPVYTTVKPSKHCVYIEKEAADFYQVQGSRLSRIQDLNDYVFQFVNAGIIPSGTRIHFPHINMKDRHLLSEMTHLNDFLSVKAQELLRDKELITVFGNRSHEFSRSRQHAEWIVNQQKAGVKVPQDILDTATLLASTKLGQQIHSKYDPGQFTRICNLLQRYFKTELADALQGHKDPFAEWSETIQRYPLLSHTLASGETLFKHYMELLTK